MIFFSYFGQKLTSKKMQVKMELFGRFIRHHRKQAGLTLTQLASQLNMDSANLSKIETGKRAFDARKLFRLAQVLNLDYQKVSNEYFSDRIAVMLADRPNYQSVLQLAEEKIRFYRQKYSTQIEFEF